jgi:GntR family transcriptional regulator/MocR family aminotransferase
MTVLGGADFLQLTAAAAPVRGLTGWLADAIRAAIMDGRLRAGAPLPATRLLADDLGVSRGVIVEAYQRLADEGLVSARPGAGTRVLGLSRPTQPPTGPPTFTGLQTFTGPPTFTGLQTFTGPPPTGPLPVPVHWRERAEIDLSPGVPDLSGFPRAAWLRAERLVLEQASVADLGYGDPRGSQSLRNELAGWLARTRGLRAGPGGIIVVTGVAQALALLARVLGARGLTEIAVEDPGSRGARDDLAYWGLRPVPVPVDEHGLHVGELARGQARAVLLTPAHQFPTGVVLAPQRRRDLLDWAAAAVRAGRRGRLRRRVPLRPGAGPGTARVSARPGRLRGQHVQDAGSRHAAGLADPARPPARRPGRGQVRQRPGQPGAAAAGAGPAHRQR